MRSPGAVTRNELGPGQLGICGVKASISPRNRALSCLERAAGSVTLVCRFFYVMRRAFWMDAVRREMKMHSLERNSCPNFDFRRAKRRRDLKPAQWFRKSKTSFLEQRYSGVGSTLWYSVCIFGMKGKT